MRFMPPSIRLLQEEGWDFYVHFFLHFPSSSGKAIINTQAKRALLQFTDLNTDYGKSCYSIRAGMHIYVKTAVTAYSFFSG